MRPAADSGVRMARLVAAVALIGLVAGCGPKPIYHWGSYEESLSASFVENDNAAALSGLQATLTAAQRTGERVPPGVHAEYGFFLYRQGQYKAAIESFQREAQLFPESKPLMDKLIAKVAEQAAAEPTQATATEGAVE